jgi:hypothetical protein
MPTENQFVVIERPSLTWPSDLQLPSQRFRLFVAADVSTTTTEIISAFAQAALECGMVYFCAWEPDCGRFHDIVDEDILGDDLGERKFKGPGERDEIMTTWHESDSLEDALDFFVNFAIPTGGFVESSNCWLAISVNNPKWAETLKQRLR